MTTVSAVDLEILSESAIYSDTNRAVGVLTELVPIIRPFTLSASATWIKWETRHDSITFLEAGLLCFGAKRYDDTGTFVTGRTRQLGPKLACSHHAICVTKRGDGDFEKHLIRLQILRRGNFVDRVWLVKLNTS